MKARIKFRKYGNMKYIGHLDVLRYFQKAVKRAEFNIAYSEGYSPHPIMSFAAPLGVGLLSDAEYMDIELVSYSDSATMCRQLNDSMADGFEIVSIRELDDNEKNAMAVVNYAEYMVYCKTSYINVTSSIVKIVDFYKQPEINILKKTKKSEKIVDIKPMIKELKIIDENTIFMGLSTGSSANLKPELVMEAFLKYIDLEADMPEYSLIITRKEIYNDKMISLEDCGKIF